MEETARFEQVVLPQLNAAYNLARWLLKNPQDAEDVVQEAMLRALKFFRGYRGGDARAWLLTIVRNTCYTWLQRNRSHEMAPLTEDITASLPEEGVNPEFSALRNANQQLVRDVLIGLPIEFREVIVLRELEGLSYKEISDVAGVPVGTVMSRLARARQRLLQSLTKEVP